MWDNDTGIKPIEWIEPESTSVATAPSEEIDLDSPLPELGHLVDNSIRMYIREIVQVPLLKPREEQLLASQWDKGRYLAEIESAWLNKYGENPSTIDIVIAVIQDFSQSLPIIEMLRNGLGLCPQAPISETLYKPRFQDALELKESQNDLGDR